MLELVDSTTLRLTRYNAAANVIVEWQVIEDAEATVQRGTTTMATSDTSTTTAVTTIDQSNTFILLSHQTNQAANNYEQSLLTTYFSADDEVTFERQTSGSEQIIAWEIVTISDASVQSGSSTLTAADSATTTNITAVDTTSAFVVAFNNSSVNQLDHRHVQVSLTDSTTVNIERTAASGVTTVNWFVVEVPRYEVQAVNSGNVSTQTVDVTISAVSTTSSWTIGSHENGGTGTNNGNSKYTIALADETTWRRTKQTTSQNTHVAGYVISMFEPPKPVEISGTLYENDGVTAVTTSKTINVAVGTSTPSVHTTTTDGSGNWSITDIPKSTIGEWSTTTAAEDDEWSVCCRW